VSIGALQLEPNENHYKSVKVEHDRIGGVFNGIKLAEILKDTTGSGKIGAEKVTVRDFALNVYRDKRLPDPPATEKPFLLEGVLRLPPGVTIREAELNNGLITYTEIAEQSGMSGVVEINNVAARIFFKDESESKMKAVASGTLYHTGALAIVYQSMNSPQFNLSANVSGFELTKLNRILGPFQQINITTGYLDDYEMNILADDSIAMGTVTMSYSNLHLDIFKRGKPEKKSGLLTFMADKLLKNSKQKSTSEINQPRVKTKSIFNYWVKSATSGALNAIRHGKRRKKK
jgi:hypothetical protein